MCIVACVASPAGNGDSPPFSKVYEREQWTEGTSLHASHCPRAHNDDWHTGAIAARPQTGKVSALCQCGHRDAYRLIPSVCNSSLEKELWIAAVVSHWWGWWRLVERGHIHAATACSLRFKKSPEHSLSTSYSLRTGGPSGFACNWTLFFCFCFWPFHNALMLFRLATCSEDGRNRFWS